MRIDAPISPGDMIDRITILRIKEEHIPDPAKRASVMQELEALNAIRGRFPQLSEPQIVSIERRLYKRNRTLWRLEDRLRALERKRSFGCVFVVAARRVYMANDRRAQLKRQINDLLGSEFREEKWFSEK